jgi:hypothetical protein
MLSAIQRCSFSEFEARPLLRIRTAVFQNSIPRSQSLPAMVGCTWERTASIPHMFAKGQIRGGINSTALSGRVSKLLYH